MRTLFLMMAVLFTVSACQPYCDNLLPSVHDGCEPNVRAKFLKEGINLKVTHARYQFKPDLDEMFTVCRNSIHYFAAKNAAEAEKQIQPIDDSKIQMSYDRNHSSGVSTCTATYPVAYAQ